VDIKKGSVVRAKIDIPHLNPLYHADPIPRNCKGTVVEVCNSSLLRVKWRIKDKTHLPPLRTSRTRYVSPSEVELIS